MTINPHTIATAIAGQLAATGLNVYALPTPARSLPCIDILPGPTFIAYRRTFGANGVAEISFDLEISLPVVSGWDDAYQTMYLLLGTGSDESIFDLLAADPTFGGVVSTSTALEVSRPSAASDATGGDVLTATFPLTVLEHRNRT